MNVSVFRQNAANLIGLGRAVWSRKCALRAAAS